MCRSLFNSPTLQDTGRYKELLNTPKAHVAEPLFAVVHCAAQSVETHGKAPLLALEFLREVYQVCFIKKLEDIVNLVVRGNRFFSGILYRKELTREKNKLPFANMVQTTAYVSN